MNFWDSSAIVPLLVHHKHTAVTTTLRNRSPGMVVWWGSETECVSAIARLLRGNAIDRDAASVGFERLRAIAAEWIEIEPSGAVRDTASRLLRAHPLRSGDALQLAAALRFADEAGSALPFVSFDQRLAVAARAERFQVFDAESDRP